MRSPHYYPGVIGTRKDGPALSWFELTHLGGRQTSLRHAVTDNGYNPSDKHRKASVITDLMQRVLAVGTMNSGWQSPPIARYALPVLVFDQSMPVSSATQKAILDYLSQYPEVWVWPAAGKPGWLAKKYRTLDQRYLYLAAGVNLASALQQVQSVVTADADEGWFALLAGKPLHVFGSAHYAGWGLTHDHHLAKKLKSGELTLECLFKRIFIDLAKYRSFGMQPNGCLEDVLDILELQRSVHQRFADLSQPSLLRFQLWKRRFAHPFVTAGGGAVRWLNRGDALKLGNQAVVWGGKSSEDVPSEIPIYRIEDGFLHSCGLGSDMVAPYSQVIDRQRLYFDARGPSDLSDLLNHHELSEELLQRAVKLREQIVRAGVTKYNLGRRYPVWQAPAGKQVILVPGQVADDASIRFGTGQFKSAEDLLREVRRRRPDGFVVYKPHPDVLSGNRQGLVEAEALADLVDADADILSLIEAADEVHTLSSLAGFDALLRGRHVVTYGKPFYAGWGLTEDVLAPLAWRERELSLDMLVAAALILYPLYWDWDLQLFTTPEIIVSKLMHDAGRRLQRVRQDRWRLVRKIRRWLSNLYWYGGERLSHARRESRQL